MLTLGQLQLSATNSPLTVKKLATKENVDRVRLVDNSRDCHGPEIVYDSASDPEWGQDGHTIDIEKFMQSM